MSTNDLFLNRQRGTLIGLAVGDALDDADTTGAICGQLAGACWGESGVPEKWREGLVRPEMIDAGLSGLGIRTT